MILGLPRGGLPGLGLTHMRGLRWRLRACGRGSHVHRSSGWGVKTPKTIYQRLTLPATRPADHSCDCLLAEERQVERQSVK